METCSWVRPGMRLTTACEHNALYGSENIPEMVFGSGELLDAFYKTMQTEAPGVWELNELFLQSWNPRAMEYRWVMPDNFHVNCKVMGTVTETVKFLDKIYTIYKKVNMPLKKGRSLSANVTHSLDGYIVREIARRCMYDPEQIMRVKTAMCYQGEPRTEGTHEHEKLKEIWNHYKVTKMLSARIFDYIHEDTVHLIDEPEAVWQLIYSLPAKPFKVISIHDCFRVHPNYGNDIRKQYNIMLSEIAKSNFLAYVLWAITGKVFRINKKEPLLWKRIQQSNYSLC